MNAESIRIVYHSKSDNRNRCMFTIMGMANYHPGDPQGEYRLAERGQVYFTDPHEHGFKRPEEIEGVEIVP